MIKSFPKFIKHFQSSQRLLQKDHWHCQQASCRFVVLHQLLQCVRPFVQFEDDPVHKGTEVLLDRPYRNGTMFLFLLTYREENSKDKLSGHEQLSTQLYHCEQAIDYHKYRKGAFRHYNNRKCSYKGDLL